MKKASGRWAMAGATALWLIAGGSAKAVETLDGEQMQTLLFGNTLTGSHPAVGAAWNAYVAPDGAIHIKGTRKEGAYEFFGQVTIEDDRWCEDWRIVDFQKKCRRITRDGDNFSVIRDDGKVLSSFVVRPGDPEGLGAGSPPAADVDPSVVVTEAPAKPAPEPAPAAAEPPPPAVQTAPAAADTSQFAAAPDDKVMRNDTIMRLHQIGQGDDSIIRLIGNSPSDFDLSPKAVEELRSAGVSTPVVKAMLNAKLGQGGGVAAAQPAAPATSDEDQEPSLPKPKSLADAGTATPPPPEVPVLEPPEPADVPAVEVAQPSAEPSADEVAQPSTEQSVAMATPDGAMPAGQGVFAIMADKPVGIPVTEVEVAIGLRMAGSENHNSAVDGFGNTPSAVLASAPAWFIVSGTEIDPHSLKLSELSYMAERRADQFNLLGIEPAYFTSVYGRAPEDNVPVGLWRPKTVIDMLIEPVAGQPGMFRLTPTEPLPPGRYALYQAGAIHPYDEVFLEETGYSAQAYYFAVGKL